MKTWTTVVSLGVIAGFAASAVADDPGNPPQVVFRAQLSGFNEAPTSLYSPARGQFYAILNREGTGFTYSLSYSGIPTNVTQSHIHLGQHHTAGGISVFLCRTTQPSAAPTCESRSTNEPITGFIDADDVIGPAGQGIAATEFVELLEAMRAGAAYVNVHSDQFPAGEIRGQIE